MSLTNFYAERAAMASDSRYRASRRAPLPYDLQIVRGWAHVTFEAEFAESRGISAEMMKLGVTAEVCPLCNGTGRHVAPNVDMCGLSDEDFDEDPDFRESYMNGDYDVECYQCGGNNVVYKPIFTPEIQAMLDDWNADEDDYDAEVEAEMRFGC